MWWPFLILTALYAGVYALVLIKSQKGVVSWRKVLRSAFMTNVWKRSTTRVDLKVYVVNYLVAILMGLTVASAFGGVVYSVATLLGAAPVTAEYVTYGPLACIAVTLLVVASLDFAYWAAHAMAHKIPALWAFHRLHHSAERLTPLTAARKHPVEAVVQNLCIVFIAGPLQGIVAAAFGGLDYYLLFGANAVTFLYNATTANLRHTHVRINFPAPFCYIFSTPAQHQIHHSRLPHHWDMNYGRLFSTWDVIFRTFYNPAPGEKISYGLSEEFGVKRPRPHQTLKDSMLEPFQFLDRKNKALAEAQQPSTTPEAADAPC